MRKRLFANKKVVVATFKAFFTYEIAEAASWSSQLYIRNREIAEAAWKPFKRLMFDLGEINGMQSSGWFSPFRRVKGKLRNIR